MSNSQFSETRLKHWNIENSLEIRNCTLKIARDKNKDQSYFLYTLTQEQLRHALFPIGEYTKQEVRQMAQVRELPTADRKDSQGLCFLGKISVHDFLKHRISGKSGKVITTRGVVVGEHDGAAYATIGQRHGIGSFGGSSPHFVVAKDIANNTLTVAEGENHPELYRRELRVCDVHWIGAEPTFSLACSARIRYRQHLESCTVERNNYGLHVVFNNPQRAVTPGQAIVFYDGDTVLGGGVIA